MAKFNHRLSLPLIIETFRFFKIIVRILERNGVALTTAVVLSMRRSTIIGRFFETRIRSFG